MYISPGGLRGFYTHGVCKFIRDNYKISNYTFHGASAGAWNSLYMSINEKKELSLKNSLYHPYMINLIKNTICTRFSKI